MMPWIVFTIAAVVAASTATAVYSSQRNQIKLLTEEVNYYRSTMLSKQGWSSGYGTYDLESYDGGQNWWAVNRANGQDVILGSAEEKFPGLLAHLDAFDRLVEYAKKNGPITLSEPNEIEQEKLMNDAGFKVERK